MAVSGSRPTFAEQADIADIARQQAQKQLEQSELFYRQTLESIPGMVFTNAPSGECDFVSDQWCEFTGAPKSEHLGSLWTNHLHPEDRVPAFRAWQAAVAGLGRYDLEYRVRHHSGRYEWFKVRGRAIRDDEGQVIRWFGTAVNIDDLKQAENALRARERELQSIADNTPDVLTRFDRQFRHLFVNAAVERVTGLSREQFLGKTNREMGMPEALCNMWEAGLCKVFATGNQETVEFGFSSPGGDRYFSTRLIPEFSPSGEVECVLGVAHDLTESKLAEAAIKASEERLARAQQAGQIGTWDWDVTTDHAVWTEQARQIFDPHGQSHEANYQRWINSVHPEDRQRVTEMAQESLKEGSYRDEYRVLSIDGEERWVESIGQVQYRDGKPVRMVGTVRDITERRRYERALRENDRHKDEFLAMLAHELRNPLAPIRNAVQILQLLNSDEPALLQARDVIARQVNHLVRLVDDLLDVSRVSRGKIVLRRDTVDLAMALRQAVETSRPIIESRNHRLTFTSPDQPIYVVGDATRLAQIVANLLNNAAKYTDVGGCIELCLSVVDASISVPNQAGPSEETQEPREQPEEPLLPLRNAIITVRDNGRGIDPSIAHKLFELFYQVDRSLDRSEGGLGIGLALVKNLVEMHGGEVSAHSCGHQQGSEFVVRLPCVAALEVVHRQGPDSETHNKSRSLQILVVDDNRDSALCMARLLRMDGHHVATAHDGKTAVDLALEKRPDVVLCDIGLPLMDGFQACRAMRAGGLATSMIVAMTGYGQEEDRQRSHQAGFDHHLVKPVELNVIRELLKQV